MSRIENFTESQIKKFPRYVEKWLKIGLSTERFSLDEAIPIIHDVQERLLKRKKTPVVLFDDPVSAWVAVCGLSSGEKVLSHVRYQVWYQVGDQVWDKVLAQVRAQVGAQVRDKVGDKVGDQVWYQVGDKVGDQIKDFIMPWLDGSFSANVFSFYDYMENELKLNMGKKWDDFLVWQKTSRLGLIWPLENVCVICQKPSALHLRDGRLHRDGSPAIDYCGKFSVWALNGVRVPKYLAETEAGKLDLDFFKKEKNAEVRAQFIRKFGVDRMKSYGSSIEKTAVYELMDMGSIFTNQDKAMYLFMRNPSTGTIHAEGVHPDCDTIIKALNWRNQTEEMPEVLT